MPEKLLPAQLPPDDRRFDFTRGLPPLQRSVLSGVLFDYRTNMHQKALLLLLLADPDITFEDLMAHTRDGRAGIYSGLAALEELGLIESVEPDQSAGLPFRALLAELDVQP